MASSRCALLRWQFDLVWSLFEFHVELLQPADFLWEPAELCWTMRRSDSDSWVPDWADAEPDPIPVPTLGWVTWHIGWWWSVTLDHLQGRTPRDRGDIAWPGPDKATVDWLRDLGEQWRHVLNQLDDTDLDATASFPWQDDPEMTVANTVAWVNAELMKNVAEIGQLRLVHTATSR